MTGTRSRRSSPLASSPPRAGGDGGFSGVGKVLHLAIAVASIAKALPLFGDALGLTVTHLERVDSQGVRVAMLPVGEMCLELLEPTNDSGPLARFLQRQGEGIHHICFEVEDIEAALAHLKARGIRLVDEQPRVGAGGARVAFLRPSSTHGVLIELQEREKCL